VPGALDEDPLTSPSLSWRAVPATDSRSYRNARKSARDAGADPAASPSAAGPGNGYESGYGSNGTHLDPLGGTHPSGPLSGLHPGGGPLSDLHGGALSDLHGGPLSDLHGGPLSDLHPSGPLSVGANGSSYPGTGYSNGYGASGYGATAYGAAEYGASDYGASDYGARYRTNGNGGAPAAPASDQAPTPAYGNPYAATPAAGPAAQTMRYEAGLPGGPQAQPYQPPPSSLPYQGLEPAGGSGQGSYTNGYSPGYDAYPADSYSADSYGADSYGSAPYGAAGSHGAGSHQAAAHSEYGYPAEG
jgi:hypothetical protein